MLPARGIQKDIVDLGVNSVHKVEVIQVYNMKVPSPKNR